MEYIFLFAIILIIAGVGGLFLGALAETWYLIPLGSLIVWLICRPWGEDTFEDEVEEHKNDLLKGGLIKRVDQRIHEEAKRRIGMERPNTKLPKREYYD